MASRRLMGSSPSRKPSSRYIIGRNSVIEALKAGTKIRKIFIMQGARGRSIDVIRMLAAENGISTADVTDANEFHSRLSKEKTQGILAIAEEKQTVGLTELIDRVGCFDEPGFLLIPDHIEDPGNLGALMRSAECAGAHGVILARHHAASLSPGTLRSAAGSIEHLLIAEVSNLVNTIRELKKQGFWIIGLDAGGEKSYTDGEYTGPIALVVGSEGKGMRRLVRENCDFLVRIPLFGKIEALNASVAGALLLFEVRRQRSGRHS